MKRFILLLSLFFYTQFIVGQVISLDNSIIVSGKIIDANTKQPLEYATISFLRAGQEEIIGTTSDTNGDFRMEIDAGVYSIQVDFLSYQSYKIKPRLLTKNFDLGPISLQSGTVLDEVEVNAEKKLVEFELNKKIYNASADIANRGGNGLDVLGNTPSVRVDSEGNISIRGNQATILIDGKPQFNLDNNTDLLTAIPSSSIDKVEIITRSAKHSAEGGGAILNIITKKRKESGLAGSLSLYSGIPDYHGFSTFVTKSSKKVHLHATVSYVNENRIKESSFEQSALGLFQDIEEDRFRNTVLFNLGSDYSLDENNTISAAVLINRNNKNNTFQIIENDFDRITDDRDDIFKYEANLGFVTKLDTTGQKLNINLNYDGTMADTEDAILESPTTSSDAIVQQSVKDQQLNNFVGKIDYTLPIGKNKTIELGYKGTFRTYENIFKVEQFDDVLNTFSTINNLDDRFRYNENVNAFYGLFSVEHGKFSYTAGLRAEISNIKTVLASENEVAKSYTDLFPSLSMSYEISDDSFLSFNYSRSIDRPEVSQLNPFISYADERFQTIGNVNLNPFYTNLIELVFEQSFEKVSLSSALFLNYKRDQFLSVIQNTGLVANNGDQIFNRTYINSGDNHIIGLDLDIYYTPFKGLRLNGYVSPYRQEITNAIDPIYNNTNTVWYAEGNALISIDNGLKINLSHVYQSPLQFGAAELKAIHFSSATVTKDLFKKKASLTFKVVDVFKSKRFLYESLEANTRTNYDVFYRNRYNLSFIYRFNQKRRSAKDRSKDVNKDDLEDKQDKKF